MHALVSHTVDIPMAIITRRPMVVLANTHAGGYTCSVRGDTCNWHFYLEQSVSGRMNGDGQCFAICTEIVIRTFFIDAFVPYANDG